MLLSDNIIKRMRAQAFGKRRIGLAGKEVGQGGFREKGFQTMWIIAGRLKTDGWQRETIKTGYITAVIPAQAGIRL